MTMDLITIVLIGLISLIFGVMVGAGLAGLRGSTKPGSSPQTRNLAEVLHIWRSRRTGRLVLEVGGKVYPAASELSVERRTRMVQLSDELRSWLGASSLEQGPAEIPPGTKPDELPAVTPKPLSESPPVSITDKASTIETIGAPASSQKMKPLSLNPIEVLTRAVSTDVPKESSAPKSIALQIDEILQERLVESPLKERAIRLMELPGKGLVVMVGMEQYEGVQEIPDPDVRDLIRECVAEWERRNDVD